MMEKFAPLSSACEIVELFDRPHYLEICTSWWFQHWGLFKPHGTFERLMKDSIEALGRGTLPKCWIAVQDDQPVGSIFLKQSEHSDLKDLSPWMGDLYVHPRHRGKGVAHLLAAHLEYEAKNTFGFDRCYVQTQMPDFYTNLGFDFIKKIRDDSELERSDISLMIKRL